MDEQRKPRGPKKQWKDVMVARFPAATFDRIEILLGEGEDRTEFVREAVAREIERRYRILKKSSTQTMTIDGREVPVVGRFVEPKPFKSELPEGRSFKAGEWHYTDSRNKLSDDD